MIDSSTILITDITKKPYTLHMTGSCVGLNDASQYLTFRAQGQSEISCLRRGDRIGYNLPGEGTPVQVRPNLQTTCAIGSVTEGAPKESHNYGVRENRGFELSEVILRGSARCVAVRVTGAPQTILCATL